MIFRRLIALTAALTAAAALCGCQTEKAVEKASEKFEIAVIAKATDSRFWQNVENGVKSAATEYNVSVSFDGPENEEDYAAQNKMIEDAVKYGADAIVLSAIDYGKNAESVNKAVKAGVKIIMMDSNVNSDKTELFIGTDNYSAGIRAGEAAIKSADKNKDIKIGIVNYSASTDNGQKREAGFKAYIDAVKNAQISAVINVDSNTQSATAGAIELLKAHPEVNVLVGFNEWTSLGVGHAIRQLNLKDEVSAIGFDSSTVLTGMLEKGEMDALIIQNPFAMGYLSVESAYKILNGSQNLKDISTSVTTVTKDNMFDEKIQKIMFRFM